MWWPPKTPDEVALGEVVPRLQEQFFSTLTNELVLGVGSFFSPTGLVPMLLLNESLLWQGSPTFKKNLGQFPMTPLATVPPAIKNQVPGWQFPNEGVALFVSPPEPCASGDTIVATTGAAIRCQATRARGTLGLHLVSPRSRAFLTVGHLCPMGVGSVVELVNERIFGSDASPLGKIVAASNPVTAGGVPAYDYAVIDLDPSVKIEAPKHHGCAVIPSPLTQPLRATLHGAVSGVKPDAAICGALNVHGGPYGIWKNSWMLLPSGIVSQGDSGAALLLNSDQSALGMVVGGSRFDGSDSYLVQYAHDMESLQRDVLSPAGYALA